MWHATTPAETAEDLQAAGIVTSALVQVVNDPSEMGYDEMITTTPKLRNTMCQPLRDIRPFYEKFDPVHTIWEIVAEEVRGALDKILKV